jgi:cytochrome c-type biogenesis protein
MNQLLTNLNHGLAGEPLIALFAAALWGVVSILLSPCHLASIPLIVAYINGQSDLRPRRAMAISSLFGVGILVTIGLVGVVTAAAGRMLGDIGNIGIYIVAAIFLLVGLHLMDIIPVRFSGITGSRRLGSGLLGALLLGLVFGIALGPCTFAFMAPMLAATFKLASSNMAYAVSLLLAYGIGHCGVIVLAGASAERVQRYLNWNNLSSATAWLRRTCGALIVLASYYLLYTAR